MAIDLPLALALAATAPPAAGAPPIAMEWVQAEAEASVEPQPAAPQPAEAAPVPAPVEGLDNSQGEVIVVSGKHGPPPGDPLATLNEKSFEVVQAIDHVVVEPVAGVYEQVPDPVRDGLHNFLQNLTEPVVALNFLLQLKPVSAVRTVGRFAINTTIGVAGLVDMAKRDPFHLAYRKNGLANTLGYYGVGPGPYLYLPLMGPTTVRDLAGRLVDLSLVPMLVGKPLTEPVVAIARGSLTSLDERLRDAPALRAIRESEDPYTAAKERYLRMRQEEIDALHSAVPAAAAPTLATP